MRVVVTGGAGFIGHHLVSRLLEAHHEVHVLDNFSTGCLDRLLVQGEKGKSNLTIHDCDIVHSKFPTLEIDAMVHLAAPISVSESLKDPEKYRNGILEGSRRCFDWAKSSGAKRIVAASTAAVYGNANEMPISENTTLDPMSPYAHYKLEMEELLSNYNSSKLDCVSLRFFNVFGEGQTTTGGYASAVPIFLEQYSKSMPITITGDGQQTRDFVYVGDVCDAVVAVLSCGWPLHSSVYNIGSGKSYRIYDLAVCLGGEIQFIARRDEPKQSLSDISRITNELEWNPSCDVIQWLGRELFNVNK